MIYNLKYHAYDWMIYNLKYHAYDWMIYNHKYHANDWMTQQISGIFGISIFVVDTISLPYVWPESDQKVQNLTMSL